MRRRLPHKLLARFQQARALHAAGRLGEAKAIYEQILAKHPNHFESLHLLGVVAIQAGQGEHGVRLIDEAIRVNPDDAAAYNNRGLALQGLRRLEEAVASFDKALDIRPDHAETCNNRGNALRDLKRLQEALASYDQALGLRPDYAEAHNNRGNVLRDLGRPEEALASYDSALALRPNLADAHSNRGNALRDLGRIDEALASYDKALALMPGDAEIHYNKGGVLQSLKRVDEALACYDRAIALRPDYADAYANRGNALCEARRLEDAVASFDRALALRPGFPDALVNKSIALLLGGDYAAGWPLFESRWHVAQDPPAMLSTGRPMWRPGDEGKRLLVWAEQGIGDEVMFGKFLSAAPQLAARTIVQLNARLIPLFARSMPQFEYVPTGETVDEGHYDVHLPIGSLGLHVCANADEFSRFPPAFLRADGQRSAALRSVLCPPDGVLCGIGWASRNPHTGWAKSMRLEPLMARIGDMGMTFVNLQYGDVADEIAAVRDRLGVDIRSADGVDIFNDLDGLAALIDACDLILSVSSVTAHLAGALGRRAWVMAQYTPDWRWGFDREDSLWYPSVRIFRQSAIGDWDSVIDRVAAELARGPAAATQTV